MAIDLRRKVFMSLEAQSLVLGGRRNLTAEEWLYLFESIKVDLEETERMVFGGWRERILARYRGFDMDKVAA